MLFRLLIVLPWLTAAMAAAASPAACEMSPAVRRELNRMPDMGDHRVPYEDRMKPVRASIAKRPDDVFLQHFYQDRFRRHLHLHGEFDRALAAYRAKPDSPVRRYFEARLTGAFHASKAEEMLQDLLTRHPDFPWPHLAIAALTDRLGARDARKAEAHLRAFLTACPSSVEGYAMLRTVDDPELIATGAARLRPLLEKTRDAVSLPYWRHLWDLEFRSAPKERQEAVRERVLRDLEALRRVPSSQTREWYSLMRYAGELTRDASIQTWLEETVLSRMRASPLVAMVERARWSRQHPRPGQGAAAADYRSYSELEQTQLTRLAERFPDDSDVILDRWLQLGGAGRSAPVETRLAIADAYAALVRRSPDFSSSTPPAAIGLASYYVAWRVRLDVVPDLVRAGLRDAELEHRYDPDSSMFPEAIRTQYRMDPIALTQWRAQTTLADLWLLRRDAARARDAILLGIASLERPGAPAPSEQERRNLEFRRRGWVAREARLAALEGDRERALELFRRYLKALGREALAPPAQLQPDVAGFVDEAKQLYLANGGSEVAWPEWVAAALDVAEPAPVAPPATPLQDFRATDLRGRTWSLADLKGKATLIDIWASWCGPCRAEHPRLQELYDRIKDRRDIQILTISMDETAYLAESYLKEGKYTFPAVVSKDLLGGAFPMGGLPQHWIVDAQGRRSAPLRLSLDPERAIAELERAARAR